MHVHFTEEEEARFAKLAAATGKRPEQLAHDILASVAVAEDETFRQLCNMGPSKPIEAS